MNSRLETVVTLFGTDSRVEFVEENEITLQLHSDDFTDSDLQYIRIDDTGTGIDLVPMGSSDISGITEVTPDKAVDWINSECLE